MAFLKVIVVLAVVSMIVARPAYNSDSQGQGPTSPAMYTYKYTAQDAGEGTHFGHAEQRDGQSSSGEYSVLLPDGRTQVVTYTVEGDSGYVAKVSYENGTGGASYNSGGYE